VTDRRWVPTRRETGAALASALLFALSFPPVPLVVPAFLCLMPVAIIVAEAADKRSGWGVAMRAGTLFGLVGYGINLYWIAIALRLYTNLAFLAFIGALLGLGPIVGFTMAALYAGRRLTRWPMAVLLPVVWATSEVFLLYLPQIGFPWLPLCCCTQVSRMRRSVAGPAPGGARSSTSCLLSRGARASSVSMRLPA